MLKFLQAITLNRDSPVDATMKRKWAVLGEKALGDRVQVWRAPKGLTSGGARSVVQSVHGEDGFEVWRQLDMQFEPKLIGPTFWSILPLW